MKVLILNTVVLNTGDAAILQGVIAILREAFGPDIHPVIFDAHADTARRYYPGVEFRRPPYQVVTGRSPASGLVRRALLKATRRPHLKRFGAGLRLWRHGHERLARLILTGHELAAIKEFSEADLVVSTGGTYLVEHYPLEPKLFDLGLVLELARPLVLFTQSLGPFREPGHRKAIHRIAAASQVVLLRDVASRDHLLDLEVPASKLEIAADAAFALPAFSVQDRESARRGTPFTGLQVAISVRSWRRFAHETADAGMKRFTMALADVTRGLVEERGARVTFLSTCQGVREYQVDDSETAADIVAALPSQIRSQVDIDRAFHTPDALLEILGRFDLVIATRMHLAILAMMAGTPTVPIAYEFKTKHLAAAMNLERVLEDIETMTGESLRDKVEWTLEHRTAIASTTAEAVARQRASARGTAAVLRERLIRPAGLDYWNTEARRYWQPHARLRAMARLLARQPRRRLLDIGCSGGALTQLLPSDFTYFGCDITDQAAEYLLHGHFLQCDLNQITDLSFFDAQSIDAIHVGGVLEYLKEPQQLLAHARRLVPRDAPLVASIINFDGQHYSNTASHHPGWIYTPGLAAFIDALHGSGWQEVTVEPFLGRGEVSDACFRMWRRLLGSDHRWIRRHARQFIVLARAV